MPRFCFLVHPSTNRVYAQDSARLAASEVRALAALTGSRIAEVAEETIAGVPYIAFDAPQLEDIELAVVSNLSTVLAIFRQEARDGRVAFLPVPTASLDRWDDDLLTVQRYPGKTNEQFTRLLLNLGIAAASGAAAFTGTKLRVLDPLSGRGTTLNQAVMYGFDAFGVEIDRRQVDAYTSFFVQWLKDKRARHTTHRELHRRDGHTLSKFSIDFSLTKEELRDRRGQRVTVLAGDSGHSDDFFRSVDAVVTDLPYGVQHGSTTEGARSRSPRDLLTVALLSWVKTLRSRGAVALSWNVNVMPRDEVARALHDAGLTLALDEQVIDFRHRVDRSILRDVIVARKDAA